MDVETFRKIISEERGGYGDSQNFTYELDNGIILTVSQKAKKTK